MSVRKLPPTFKGNLSAWAAEIQHYLASLAPATAKNQPEPVFLSHQSTGKKQSATTAGIVMYDPAAKQPVYSRDDMWVPFTSTGKLSYAVTDSTGDNVDDINSTDYTGQEGAVGACAQCPVGIEVSFYHAGIQYLYAGPTPASYGAGCADTMQASYLIASGIGDHGALSGLADDDHLQYHIDARGPDTWKTQAEIKAHIDSAANPHLTTYLKLTDTIDPAYSGKMDMMPAVTLAEDGLEFQKQGVRVHSDQATYEFDDLVAYEGTVYHCIIPHTAEPFSLTNFVPIATATGSGIQLTYRWDTSISGDPGSGRFAITDPMANPTNTLRVSDTTAGGVNVDNFLDAINAGDYVLFIEDTGGAESGIWIANAPAVDQGTYHDIPVNWVANTGEPENNRQGIVSLIYNPQSKVPAGGLTGQSLLKTTNNDYETEWNWPNRIQWRDAFIQGLTYELNDMAWQGVYTGVANKQTTDPVAPQNVGDPFYPYAGTLAPNITNAKQIIFGTRYEAAGSGGQVVGYRIETTVGNEYSVYLVDDPLGAGIITQGPTFVADIDGWTEFSVAGGIVSEGRIFDLVATVSEPDPTVTVNTAPYNYQMPNNHADAGAGVFLHSNRGGGLVSINKTANDSTPFGTELDAMQVGDKLSADGKIWTIQELISSDALRVEWIIAPDEQLTSVGIRDFNFEVVTPVPLTIGADPDVNYWDTAGYPNVSGLFFADAPYDPSITDRRAYGADLLVQEVAFSDDWDLLPQAGSGSSGDAPAPGVTTFAQLTDTPANYAGAADKAVVVKTDETGLEFVDGLWVLKAGDDVTGTLTYQNSEAMYLRTDGNKIIRFQNQGGINQAAFWWSDSVSTMRLSNMDGAGTIQLAWDYGFPPQELATDPTDVIRLKDLTDAGGYVSKLGDTMSGTLETPKVVTFQTGSQTLPVFTFGAATDTGMYYNPLPQIRFTLAGIQTYQMPEAAGGTTSLTVLNKARYDELVASSARYKELIAPAKTVLTSSATDKVQELTPRFFSWGGELNEADERYGQPSFGLIAEEVNQVLPEAVLYSWVDEYDANGELVEPREKRIQTLDPLALISLLVESNKELTARIEALENDPPST